MHELAKWRASQQYQGGPSWHQRDLQRYGQRHLGLIAISMREAVVGRPQRQPDYRQL
jgi:hypothetical protein